MIEILMATYNGEAYLRAQLESIFQQTYTEWKLIVRDDCSTDSTSAILKEYAERYPDKMTVLWADEPSGSAQNNFFRLIQHSTAEYVMFADQDDVWLKHKVECTMMRMTMKEAEVGKDIPILVHTDLAVVDRELKVLNASLFNMHNMDANRNKLNNILVQNVVTGCTMMVNRALLDKVTVVPQNAVMHDMWLALIASAFGVICFEPQPTMLYRQHGDNADGAKRMNTVKYQAEMVQNESGVREKLRAQYRQAVEFERVFGEQLGERDRNMLKAFGALEHSGKGKRYSVLSQYGLFKKGLVRKIGQVMFG